MALDPTGLGAGWESEIANLLGGGNYNFAAGAALDPTGLGAGDVAFNSAGQLGLSPSALSSMGLSGGSNWLDYLKNGSSISKLLSNQGLLGAALGAGAGALGGAKQSGTTTVTNEPWAAQQPYLMAGFNNALGTLGAAYPSYTLGPAQAGLLSTINGDYLNANPYLDATFNKAADAITPRIEALFSKYGRSGGNNSSAASLGNTLSGLATDIYGQNYQAERARQNQGILAAPAFSQGMTGAQFAPVSAYMSAIGANRGNSTSSPYYTNPLGSILSGALTGYQLLK
jgi:hypothetical protein